MSVIAQSQIGDAPVTVLNGDYDWYQLHDVQPGQTISAMVDARTLGLTLKSTVGIYDAAGNLVAYSPLGSLRENSYVKYAVPSTMAAGDYFVVVHGGTKFQTDVTDSNTGSGVGTLGSYRVTIGLDSSRQPLFPSPAEPDSSRTLAKDTGLGNGVGLRNQAAVVAEATIGDAGLSNGDYDWYAIRNVQQNQEITVNVNSASFGNLNSHIAVYNSISSTPLQLGTTTSGNSSLRFTAPLAGDYFIVVYGGNGVQSNPDSPNSGTGAVTTGNYQITIGLDFHDLKSAIEGPGTTFVATPTLGVTYGANATPGANVNAAALPAVSPPDRELPTELYGTNKVATAFAWSVDPNASTATLTTTLTLIARDPAVVVSTGATVTLSSVIPPPTDPTVTPDPVTQTPHLLLEGSAGVAPNHHPVVVNSDMTRAQVAAVIDQQLEDVFDRQAIVAQPGSSYADGDQFVLDDGANQLTFEMDSGFVLLVPTAGGNNALGGIADGDTFEVSDIPDGGTDRVIFEFDKDGLLSTTAPAAPGILWPIAITDTTTQLGVSHAIANAITQFSQAYPAMAQNLGLNPRVVNGGVQLPGNYTDAYPGALQTSLSITPVTATVTPVTSVEPNGTLGTAVNTALAGRGAVEVNSIIGNAPAAVTNGDYDWYRIQRLNAGDKLTVTATGAGGLNPSVGIYDAGGNLILSRLVTPGLVAPVNTFDFLAPSAGVYYIVVHGNGAFQTNPGNANSGAGGIQSVGSYTLDLTVEGGGLNRTAGQPGVTPGTQPVVFAPATDFTASDVAQAIATAINGQITLRLTAAVPTAGAADQRRVILTPISLLQPRVLLTAGLSGNVGAPRLVTATEDNGALTTANNTGIFGTGSAIVRSFIGNAPASVTNGDYDWYRLNNIAAGQTIEVAVKTNGSGLDAAIGIYDANGVLQDFRLGTGGDNSIGLDPNDPSNLAFIAKAPGTYYIVVHGKAAFQTNPRDSNSGSPTDPGTTGGYELTIVLPTGAKVPLAMEAPVNLFKTSKDLIHIVGHDIIDQGPLGADTGPLSGDKALYGNPFGVLGANRVGFNDPARGQNNNFEGVYLDDFIIGFAERGEMGTIDPRAASTDTSFYVVPPDQVNPFDVNTGEYQLEIRRSADYYYASYIRPNTPPNRSVDTNARLDQSTTLVIPAAKDLYDGETFKISDGINTVTFEFKEKGHEDTAVNGHQVITFDPGVLTTLAGGAPTYTPESDYVIAQRVRDVINSAPVQNVLKVTAAASDGKIPATEASTGVPSTANLINLFGPATVTWDPADVQIYNDTGDTNTPRDQGQMIVADNTITNATNYGLLVDNGSRRRDDLVPPSATSALPLGNLPHPGPARNLIVLNTQRLVPGATIENNLIANNGLGGISFSGDALVANTQNAVAPFGRILNNTIVGNNAGDTGINVGANASPTLLNNIVANFGRTGVFVDPTSASTVIGGTLFQGNATNGNIAGVIASATQPVGEFSLQLTATQPLFVNAAGGNYYLAKGSAAIDNAVQNLRDRPALTSVTSPLGIAASPILAPSTDLTGQVRVSAASGSSGTGQNPFIDRGAIDRADNIGPTAVLITPADNDAAQVDQDAAATVVRLTPDTILEKFAIQFNDGVPPADPARGTGVDNNTVSTSQVVVTRDGQLLTDGIDYVYSYNPTNHTIQLTPLSGIWAPNHAYVVTLNNTDKYRLTAPNGWQLSDGNKFQITDATADANSRNFEFDSGYSIQVPQTLAITVPIQGGALGGVADGNTFTIGDGINTVTFEFDSNNQLAVTTNRRIPFTSASSAVEIADQIVAVVGSAGLGLFPVNLGTILDAQGSPTVQVHLGTRANHTLDISGTPKLTKSGQAGGVADGETFTVDNFTKLVTFEFEDTAIGNGVASGHIPIYFSPRNTQDEIAAAMASTISGANLGLTPIAMANGVVYAGGTMADTINLKGAPSLVLQGAPGVSPDWGIKIPSVMGYPVNLTAGTTFSLRNGGNPDAVFEFTSNGTTTAPNIAVAFRPSTDPNPTTVDELAATIIGAIQGAGLQLTPLYLHYGIISLGGTSNHALDTRTSSLIALGTPGVAGSVAVPFTPQTTFDDAQVAVSIIHAINGSPLVGVTAVAAGGAQVDVLGGDVKGLGGVFNGTIGNLQKLPGIKDLAANPLKANQLSGETKFTVILGSASLDFGDAPDPTYPTLLASNGAVHVLQTGFFLGTGIDAESDGVPNSTATGDSNDEDGVTFLGSLNGTASTLVQVTASAPGLLDAWVDFNQNGSWDDAGEQIFASQPLVAGINTLQVSAPADVRSGQTFARFRLSSTGGLRPTGIAPDGEVEDYRVNVSTATPPSVPTPSLPNPFYKNAVTAGYLLPGSSLLIGIYDLTSTLGATIKVDNNPSPGTFHYDPTKVTSLQKLDEGQSATDTFTYRVKDAATGLLSAQATVTITVQGRNTAPLAVNDIAQTDAHTAVLVSVLANDSDPEGQPLTITNVTPGIGLVQISADKKSVLYDPNGQFSRVKVGQTAPDSFSYTVTDPYGQTSTASVSVSVAGVNEPPQVLRSVIATTPENLAVDMDGIKDSANQPYVVDPKGDPLTVKQVQLIGTKGTASVNPDGTLHYNPNHKFDSLAVGEQATDVFNYIVANPAGLTALGTVTVTVTGVNNAPTAVNDVRSVSKNSSLVINVLGNDYDTDKSDTLTVRSPLDTTTAPATKGQVQLNVDNTVTYTPGSAFAYLVPGTSAQDVFRYTISDNHGVTATATVTVTIQGANSPPVATTDATVVDKNKTVVIDVLQNDVNYSSSALTIVSADSTGLKGKLVINAPVGQQRGTITYNPNDAFDSMPAGQSAIETFTYVITDGQSTSLPGTVTVTVRGLNTPPIANPDFYTLQRGGTLTTNVASAPYGVLANDTDVETGEKATLTAVLITSPRFATTGGFHFNSDGTFTYTNNGSSATSDSFQYQTVDHPTTGASLPSDNIVTVVIQITAVPTSPWQNPGTNANDRYDVNASGAVTPIDVLTEINYVNAHSNPVLPAPGPNGPPPYYDVNGDGLANALDVLLIINAINTQNNTPSGEGEAVAAAQPAAVLGTSILAAPANGTNAASLTASPVPAALTQTLPAAPVSGPVNPAQGTAVTATRYSQTEDTVRLDLYGVDDVLGSLAQEIGKSQVRDQALESLLDELLV